MQPLDLVFFKGVDFVSRTVLLAQEINVGRNDFSHVGIVINKELLNIDQLNPGVLYIMESTVSDGRVLDSVTNTRIIGVQIRPLNQVIDSYKVEPGCLVAWARLKNNPFITEKEKVISQFRKIYKKYGDNFYNMNPLDLLASFIPCMRTPRNLFDKIIRGSEILIHNHRNFNRDEWVFCSQLIAIIYVDLKIIPADTIPENVIPMDLLGYDRDGLFSPVELMQYL